jgi:cytidine deaminase
MKEFCEDDFIILLGKDGEEYMSITLSELLPLSFSKSNIEK